MVREQHCQEKGEVEGVEIIETSMGWFMEAG